MFKKEKEKKYIMIEINCIVNNKKQKNAPIEDHLNHTPLLFNSLAKTRRVSFKSQASLPIYPAFIVQGPKYASTMCPYFFSIHFVKSVSF